MEGKYISVSKMLKDGDYLKLKTKIEELNTLAPPQIVEEE